MPLDEKYANYQFSISIRAIAQRINRKLRPDYEQVRKTRGWLLYERDFGDYYLIDFNRNWITDKDVDLDKLGRELKVLHPWEVIGEE